MTDGDLIGVMVRLQKHCDEIIYILNEEIVNHENGEALCGELHDNGLGYNWDLADIAHSHLRHPERWRCLDGVLRFRQTLGMKGKIK